MKSRILKFSISNCSGISEKVEIDFSAGRYKFYNEFKDSDKLVNPLFLYGKNSSGKTSILKSLLNLRELMIRDLTITKSIFYPNIPKMENTVFSIELQIDDELYEYNLEIESSTKNNIKSETLKVNSKELNRYDYKIDSNVSLVRYLGREQMDESATKLFEYFKSIDYISTYNTVETNGNFSKSFNEILVEQSTAIRKFANEFDELPIYDLKIKEDLERNSRLYAILHKEDNTSHLAPFEVVVSSGARSFYQLVAMLSAKPKGSLLIIDEIDNTIHPTIIEKFVKLMNTEFDIQVLCSSHNVTLLKRLRPDQVYLCKNEEGVVTSSKVSAIFPEIREIHNIEALYLGGRLG